MTAVRRGRIVLVGPLPPPYAGPEISTKLLLESPLVERHEVFAVPSNFSPTNEGKGRPTVGKGVILLGILRRIARHRFRDRAELVYHLLSQGKTGFFKDGIIALFARSLGMRVVSHLRGSNFDRFYGRQQPGFQRFIRRTLGAARTIIVQNEPMVAVFNRLAPKASVTKVYNAIRAADFRRTADETAALASAGQPNGRPITILFVGHLSFAKGFYDLMLAVPEVVRRTDGRVRFRFAGERITLEQERNILAHEVSSRDDLAEVEREVERLIVAHAERLEFVGLVSGEAKRNLFAQADIFTLPSYSEGFSMAMLEALTVGLPVVVTPVGAHGEVIRDGEHGFIVTPGDSAALADRIARLALDNDKRRRMQQENRVYVEQTFDIAVIAHRLADVFDDALA